ncbi:MAG: transketolase [Elusimicrobia bacterium]|nr:transketolase [Elusimicrobiota bacterium]
MRTAFFKALLESARRDPRIHLVTGDLGFSVVEAFAAELPAQFLNAGVAEQNMTGIAAGLALSGNIVFTYSIGNFPILRCLEQIRNDVCYHKANVKIVSVGGGFAYGSLGMTHHATEDLAIMRALPNMTVLAPADGREVTAAVRAMIERPGPCYLRLGRNGEPVLHENDFSFEIGRAIEMRSGNDVTIIASGSILALGLQAAKILSQEGIEARVLSMPSIKPFDEAAVIRAASQTRALISVEEHSVVGGLGSAVAEVLLAKDLGRTPFRSLGVPDQFCPSAGSQEYLMEKCGLTVSRIVETARTLLSNLVPA